MAGPDSDGDGGPPATAAAAAQDATTRRPVPSRDEFIAAWQELGGSVRAVARHFGRDRRQIYRWLVAHGVRPRPRG